MFDIGLLQQRKSVMDSARFDIRLRGLYVALACLVAIGN